MEEIYRRIRKYLKNNKISSYLWISFSLLAIILSFVLWEIIGLALCVFLLSFILVACNPDKIFDIFFIDKKGKAYTTIRRLKNTLILLGAVTFWISITPIIKTNWINEKNHLDDRFKDGATLLAEEKFYSTLSGISILREVVIEAKNEKKHIKNVRNVLCVFMRDYTFKEKIENDADDAKRKIIFQDIVNTLSIFPPHKEGLDSLDLSDCNLNGLDLKKLGKKFLRKANLKNTKLKGADLAGADLTEADLTKADLSYNTILTGADFSYATLCDVNFSNADLSGVNFYKADLSYADFTHSDIRNTQFKEAIMYYARLDYISEDHVNEKTNFKDAKLDRAKISSRILGAKNIHTGNAIVINW